MLRREPWLDDEARADARMALMVTHLANLLAPRKDKQPWSMEDFMPKWKSSSKQPATSQELSGLARLAAEAGLGKMVH